MLGFKVQGSGFRCARLNAPAFTLIELVIAMSMVAVLAMSLYASMRIAFTAQSSADTSLEPPRTASLALNFLREDLQNALPPTGILAGAFLGYDGRADNGRDGDSIEFFSTAPGKDHISANGDIKKIELLVTDVDGELSLVRRVTRNLLSEVESDPDEEILCRGVASFNLRYFDGTDWQDTWDSTTVDNTLPTAVEVTIELDRKQADGQMKTNRYINVCAIPCAAPATDTTGVAP